MIRDKQTTSLISGNNSGTPEKAVLGHGQLLSGLEIALSSMKMGERSLFHV